MPHPTGKIRFPRNLSRTTPAALTYSFSLAQSLPYRFSEETWKIHRRASTRGGERSLGKEGKKSGVSRGPRRGVRLCSTDPIPLDAIYQTPGFWLASNPAGHPLLHICFVGDRWLNNKGLLGSAERMVHRVEIVGQDAGWTCGFVENENVREGFFLSVKFVAFPWDRL